MMTIATHAFPGADALDHEYRRSLHMIARLEQTLQVETSDKRYGCRVLAESSRTCGTIASVLMDDGGETARRHMADAERYGRRQLTEIGHNMKVGEIEVYYGPSGPLSIVERKMPAPPANPPLAIHYFYDALLTTIAFGDAAALAAFAAFPESGYRSPNMIASEGVYALMRAYQAWLSGEHQQARVELQIVVRNESAEQVRAGVETLRAIMARDARTFQMTLRACLTAHKAFAKKNPLDPDVMISWTALALARLAKAQGLPVADDGYLPARLLPAGPIR